VPETRALWRRLTAGCHLVLSFLLAVSVAILVIPVSMQIFSRFTSIIPHYIWTEEMSRFLFIWMVMLGAIVGVRESAHFIVDLWPRLGPRAEAALKLLSGLAVLVFALVFVIAGWRFTAFGWYRISELAELPLWTIHIAWPITGGFWLLFLGEQMWDAARTLAGGRR